jgi:hypothetical protein
MYLVDVVFDRGHRVAVLCHVGLSQLLYIVAGELEGQPKDCIDINAINYAGSCTFNSLRSRSVAALV